MYRSDQQNRAEAEQGQPADQQHGDAGPITSRHPELDRVHGGEPGAGDRGVGADTSSDRDTRSTVRHGEGDGRRAECRTQREGEKPPGDGSLSVDRFHEHIVDSVQPDQGDTGREQPPRAGGEQAMRVPSIGVDRRAFSNGRPV
jgi:hypothetical protein